GLCRQGLEDGHEPIRYSLRGSVYSIIRVNLKPALNTEILTPPRSALLLIPTMYAGLTARFLMC
ncbi:hypothetical protein ACUHMQ_20315, partial [Chitinimonas sp. PSY-7]|uniref:hypothetical protein n=1 Tax=Chitinimonas sp. PSY-7 TaxID=3459088 RepID=UPI0040402FAD